MLLTIPSIDNPVRYSVDTTYIKSICDKIKTLDRDFKMNLHVCKSQLKWKNKKEVADIDKSSIACSCVSRKLLMYPIEDKCCER